MLHAREDYNRIQDPENKIPKDEPVFLIRAQDRIAPSVLRAYAEIHMLINGDADMCAIIKLHANKMKLWQMQHKVKVADL